MQYNLICCLDLETCSNRKSDTEITQIGAKIINPRNLEPFRGGNAEFVSDMRVLDESKIQEDALFITRKTREQVLSGPDPGEVWHRFTTWLKQWYLGGKTSNQWAAPILAGHNVVKFDSVILDRYAYKYGTTREDKNGEIVPALFHPLITYDTLQILGYWSENLKHPSKLSLDYLRGYLGFPKSRSEVAHDALQDVRDTADILVKLLALEREIAPRVKFKNCFGFAEEKEMAK